jgi:hypothetical protein
LQVFEELVEESLAAHLHHGAPDRNLLLARAPTMSGSHRAFELYITGCEFGGNGLAS